MISATNLFSAKNTYAVNNQNVSTPKIKVYSQPKADIVAFTGSHPLTRKYKIDPDKVQIKSDMPYEIDKKEKAVLIEKVLESYEMAQKNLKWGNIARIGYASNIGLEDGSWHLASNFNNTRNDISSVCGERSAVIEAFNNKLKSMSLDKMDSDENFKNTNNYDFNVKYIAMSNHKELGTDRNAGAPCTDCLSWFNTNRFFDNETKIITLVKNEETNSYDLCLRNLVELLPYRMELDSLNKTSNELTSLPLELTQAAKDVIEDKQITESQIQKLVEDAKNNYESNDLASFTNQNVTSSLLCNGEVFSAKKVDWSKRWFVEPAEHAATKAIEKFGHGTKVDAIAYYGEGSTVDNYGIKHDDGVVSIQTLGRLNTKYGSPETLVITVQDDKVAVRTIGDYMPSKFNFVQDYIKNNRT